MNDFLKINSFKTQDQSNLDPQISLVYGRLVLQILKNF